MDASSRGGPAVRDARGAPRLPESGPSWTAECAEVTARAAARLAEVTLRAGGPEPVRAVRDLAEQAAIWLEAWEAEAGLARDAPTVEAAAWVGRLATGLAARLRRPPPDASPEARRAAAACLGDLDRMRRWADGVLRRAERRGEAARLHRLRAGLPSAREISFRPRRRPTSHLAPRA